LTCAVLLLWPLCSGVARAGQAVGTVNREVQLASVRARLLDLGQELAALGGRTDDVVASFARTRAELDLQEHRVREAEIEAAVAADQAGEAEAQLVSLEGELEDRRAALRRRLVSIESLGRRGYLELVLTLDPEAELLPALRQLRFVIRRDDEAIRRFGETRAEMLETRAELERRRRASESWLQAEEERRRELVTARRRQAGMLEELEARHQRLALETAGLRSTGERLERLGAALLAEDAALLLGVPIQELKGALDWPLPGVVAVPFGRRRDPRYGTEMPHNGVELEVVEGSPVRAVYPGEVRFAAPFQDLGFTVVIQHPGRVLTLYAGLGELRVAEGDVVVLNTAIGVARERLYFEIRVAATPEDPRSWLR
jgi:septal ring factor EnvC (AmiA/AmiB activator)